MTPEVGKTYLVKHCRKGTFTARIVKVGTSFTDLVIVDGKAKFIGSMNSDLGEVGDCISVRTSFCDFTEVEQ